MSALINHPFPLITVGAQGPRVFGSGPSSLVTHVGLIKISRESTGNACVHLFARHVRFAPLVAERRAAAARLDVAIADKLKELGYGG